MGTYGLVGDVDSQTSAEKQESTRQLHWQRNSIGLGLEVSDKHGMIGEILVARQFVQTET